MYIPEEKFSLWADFIERDYLDNGFRTLIEEGIINGATSNPSIFKSAILTSPAYKRQIEELSGLDAKAKYEALAIYDIQKAADILRPLYDKGDDGYVSIEVDPMLCDDTEATVDEGRRLYKLIDRPNVMIKVPATEAGYGAMRTLVSDGIAVNATLVFSKEQALAAADAFADGQQKGASVDTVISVFVSRIDRALDAVLVEKGITPALAGIYNAAAIYSAIEAKGVSRCRTLFASTGVKGGDLRPSYYIDELLAANTVNTAPVETIEAFVKKGDRTIKLPVDAETIDAHFAKIEAAGIDFDGVVAKQISDGLDAFKEAFSEILSELE
ncbi:transaldolase [Sulfurimonas sp. HSL3-7]|uniref:transaldolase n=1 Tax=Sulfonitrofixus jiaomeiensis TaxID=3131938 RepID=UPI0031F95CF7